MHTDKKLPHDQAKRQLWQRPSVSRLVAGAAELGSGNGGDGLAQVQS